MQWKIGVRNVDKEFAERQQQKRKITEVLIIPPESFHLLLAQKGHPEIFKQLKIIAVDEWHELLGGKRGVQVELALSRIINIASADLQEEANRKPQTASLCVWGISATIGNLEEAREVLLSP